MSTNIIDDIDQSIRAPFDISELGKPYASLKEQIAALNASDLQNVEDADKSYLVNYQKEDNETAIEFGTGGYTDSSIGGNDALNPLWQFNIDDDIIWPVMEIKQKVDRGLGRVYNEMYQDTQHILWLSFGVPKFRPLQDFYQDAGDSRLASIMRSEDSLAKKIGNIVGAGIAIAIKLPIYPLLGIINLTKAVTDLLTGVKVNKYYEFVPRMDLYYKAVSIILANLTVNMNLLPNSNEKSDDPEVEELTPDINQLGPEGIKRLENIRPEILEKGADILYLLSKRDRWKNNKKDSSDMSLLENIKSAADYMKNDALRAKQYIGFRIERGSDFSESVSNATGEAEISSKLNGLISSASEKRFSISRGNLGKGVVSSALETVTSSVENIAKGLGNMLKLGDAITLVAQGSGYFDIPEVWKNSSFSKSYSFDIQLRSRYGDPISIYQSIYVPLAMLMAGAFPVGVGRNTYTSPFLCQAYSRGLFSIPTGIIESMSIRRGLSEHGWTYDRLPTAIDISISIKDMSPAMFLSLVDGNILKVLSSNDSMKMYLSTLAGLNIYELMSRREQFKRRWKTLLLVNKANTFNPRYWSIKAAQSRPVRAVTALAKWNTPNT